MAYKIDYLILRLFNLCDHSNKNKYHNKTMSVISPLHEEHIYTVDLDQDCPNEIIVKVFDFLKKKNFKPEPVDLVKLIKFIKNPLVFKMLIELLPYPNWIKWFTDISILKYYWSTELINKIIDSNRSKINCAILNGDNFDDHLINMTNTYDKNYNYIQPVLKKRLEKIKECLALYDIDITKLYGGTNVISFIGLNNKIGKDNVVLTFYPNTKLRIVLKQQVSYDIANGFIIISATNMIIKIYQKEVTTSNIFALDNGYINFDTQDIFVTAEFYQLYQINKKIELNQESNIIITWKKSATPIYFVITNVKVNIDKLYHYEACYECKKYHSGMCINGTICHCMSCSVINYHHRSETTDLTGFTAFITGIRVKIGFALAVRILRLGGKVIGTTRFTNFALYNFSQESDFDIWKDRLIIIECDFTNIDMVYNVIEMVKKYPINAIYNNAYRTVMASEYYNSTVRGLEKEFYEKMLLKNKAEQTTTLAKYDKNVHKIYTNIQSLDCTDLTAHRPPVQFNKFHDVVEIKHDNSWEKPIEKVDPKEIVECVAINQLVPTLFISCLKSHLTKPKFVIQVASPEGTFNTKKTNTHVHTNMCKSALNMLIRGLAEDTDSDLRAFTIDVGYVSGPFPGKEKYPVTLEDTSAKLLFPVIRHYNGKPLEKSFVNLRHYKPNVW